MICLDLKNIRLLFKNWQMMCTTAIFVALSHSIPTFPCLAHENMDKGGGLFAKRSVETELFDDEEDSNNNKS